MDGRTTLWNSGCILVNVTHWTTAITDRPKLLKPGYSALSEMKWSPCDGWPHDSLEFGINKTREIQY